MQQIYFIICRTYFTDGSSDCHCQLGNKMWQGRAVRDKLVYCRLLFATFLKFALGWRLIPGTFEGWRCVNAYDSETN